MRWGCDVRVRSASHALASRARVTTQPSELNVDPPNNRIVVFRLAHRCRGFRADIAACHAPAPISPAHLVKHTHQAMARSARDGLTGDDMRAAAATAAVFREFDRLTR
jgi:hypothetical protein